MNVHSENFKKIKKPTAKLLGKMEMSLTF